MRRTLIVVSLLLAVAAIALADVWDGSRIQPVTDGAISGTFTPAQVQSRTVAIVNDLQWPARQVSQSADGRIKVFVRVDE